MYTVLRNPLRGLHGVYNLIEVISSWTEQKLWSILNYSFGIFNVFQENIFAIMSTEIWSALDLLLLLLD